MRYVFLLNEKNIRNKNIVFFPNHCTHVVHSFFKRILMLNDLPYFSPFLISIMHPIFGDVDAYFYVFLQISIVYPIQILIVEHLDQI